MFQYGMQGAKEASGSGGGKDLSCAGGEVEGGGHQEGESETVANDLFALSRPPQSAGIYICESTAALVLVLTEPITKSSGRQKWACSFALLSLAGIQSENITQATSIQEPLRFASKNVEGCDKQERKHYALVKSVPWGVEPLSKGQARWSNDWLVYDVLQCRVYW